MLSAEVLADVILPQGGITIDLGCTRGAGGDQCPSLSISVTDAPRHAGDTATGATKQVTLETDGSRALFIETGDVVRVDTRIWAVPDASSTPPISRRWGRIGIPGSDIDTRPWRNPTALSSLPRQPLHRDSGAFPLQRRVRSPELHVIAPRRETLPAPTVPSIKSTPLLRSTMRCRAPARPSRSVAIGVMLPRCVPTRLPKRVGGDLGRWLAQGAVARRPAQLSWLVARADVGRGVQGLRGRRRPATGGGGR